MEDETIQGNPSRWRWALVALLVVIAASAFLVRPQELWDWLKLHQGEMEEYVSEQLVLTLAALFVIYVVITGLSLPFAATMTVVCGVLLGRWLGLALVSFASTTGATLAFLSSRFLLRDWVRSRYGPRLEAIDRGMERSGVYYLLVLRLNPFVPYFLINLALGLTRMPVWTFWVVSQIGMLPITFLYVSAAAELAGLEKPGDLLAPRVLVYLALASLTPLALRQVFRRSSPTMATAEAGASVEHPRP